MQSIAHNSDQYRYKAVAEGGLFDIDSESRIIRGFITVEIPDLANDITDISSFDFAKYLVNPQILVNHKNYKKPDGNDGPVGVMRSIQKGYIKDEDPHVLSVYNYDHKLIGMYPKIKTVDHKDGQHVIWGEAEITEESFWPKIVNGEFNAFSWAGYSSKFEDRNSTTSRLIDVDLLEVSVVNMPANRSATFYIPRTQPIETIAFSGNFGSDDVYKYIQDFKFGEYDTTKKGDTLYLSKNHVVEIPDEVLSSGVSIAYTSENTMADTTENTIVEDKTEKNTSTQEVVEIPEKEVETKDVKVEETKAETKNVDAPVIEPKEVKVNDDEITKSLRETFMEMLKPVTEKITALEKKCLDLEALAKRENTSNELVSKKLEEIAKTVQTEIKEFLQKSFDTESNEREEQVTKKDMTKKSLSDDPYKVFDGFLI